MGKFVSLMVKTRKFDGNGSLVKADYPIRTLPYTTESRNELLARRDMLLDKGQRAFILATLSSLEAVDTPVPDSRRTRRLRQRLMARLVARLTRRTPKVAVSEEDQRGVDAALEEERERRRRTGLALPGSTEFEKTRRAGASR